MLKQQSRNFFIMVSSFIVILFSALLRGGEGKPSVIGISSCSFESWMTLIISQSLCIFIAVSAYRANKQILDDDAHLSGSHLQIEVISKIYRYFGLTKRTTEEETLHSVLLYWNRSWCAWNWRRNDTRPCHVSSRNRSSGVNCSLRFHSTLHIFQHNFVVHHRGSDTLRSRMAFHDTQLSRFSARYICAQKDHQEIQ